MERVNLALKLPKNKTTEYNDVVIEITPFIGLTQQAVLIERYLNEYFNLDGEQSNIVKGSPYDYLGAEYSLRHSVLQLVTNIDVGESVDTDMYDATNLWIQVESAIINYDEFRARLDRIVSDVKEELVLKQSLGNLLEKALNVLEKFSEFDPGDVEKIKATAEELMAEAEKITIIGGQPKQAKSRSKRKTQ